MYAPVTQDQVRDLLPILENFVNTGELAYPEVIELREVVWQQAVREIEAVLNSLNGIELNTAFLVGDVGVDPYEPKKLKEGISEQVDTIIENAIKMRRVLFPK